MKSNILYCTERVAYQRVAKHKATQGYKTVQKDQNGHESYPERRSRRENRITRLEIAFYGCLAQFLLTVFPRRAPARLEPSLNASSGVFQVLFQVYWILFGLCYYNPVIDYYLFMIRLFYLLLFGPLVKF